MSNLQNQVIQSVKSTEQKQNRKLGILKGKKLIADGYDLDECNNEIAEMFGVDEWSRKLNSHLRKLGTQ